MKIPLLRPVVCLDHFLGDGLVRAEVGNGNFYQEPEVEV